MTRRVALTLPLFVALLSGVAPHAQEAPAKPVGPAKPKGEATEVVDVVKKGKSQRGQKIEVVDVSKRIDAGPNVRVEFTLTDQQTGAPTTTKTVMLTTGNRSWGRLRSQIESRVYGVAPLNVDARPTVMPDGRVNVRTDD